jgi:glutamate formiminotransferase
VNELKQLITPAPKLGSMKLHAEGNIIECVANFSEGRDAGVIQTLVSAVSGASGLILNVFSDPDHHRTVVSFITGKEQAEEAAFGLIAKAVELVDLRRHQGVHPRIGAADVVPFVPIREVTMEDCVLLARRLGQRVAEELQVPVYLYEEAALRPDRTQLPDIRRGGFEGLAELIQSDPGRAPDFGPARLHPTAGAVVIGARRPLIAYNVFLDATDVRVAREIARRIRERDGGLARVRAMGFAIASRGSTQVSVNLRNYEVTSLVEVWERIGREAALLGARPISSEIVGLVPEAALPPDPVATLKLEAFHPGLVLEKRIREVLQGARADAS